ncbi:pentapeptide repeat-containing protein [Lewinella sp. W8]|uniref:pentapeptide repeat-containing protein n=1 Tax=Lewinella sp. W8 TaxID=2528208 RepID=UPI0010677DF9|nr:pentapeptide repeat-containing protein [Lewinella sp. W8]MTB51764.1 hypothetical protein [Lewinella sp. W8]
MINQIIIWFNAISKNINKDFIKGISIGLILMMFYTVYDAFETAEFIVKPMIFTGVGLVTAIVMASIYIDKNKEIFKKYVEDNVDDFIEDEQRVIIEVVEATMSPQRAKKVPKALKKSKSLKAIAKLSPIVAGLIARFFALSTLLSVLGATVSLALFLATYMQVKHLEIQNDLISAQNKKIDVQNNLAEATRRAALIYELTAVLDEIDEELDILEKKRIKEKINIKSLKLDTVDYEYEEYLEKLGLVKNTFWGYFNTERYENEISSRLVGRIIALSKVLRPYRQLSNDTTLSTYLSPERGQLLVSLVESSLNFNSLTNGDFSFMALANLEIGSPDFVSEDYMRSKIKDLRYLKAQNCNLSNVIFYKTSFSNSDFSEGSLVDVEFNENDLSSVDFSSTNIVNSKMTHSYIYQLYLNDAYLDGLIIENSFLYGYGAPLLVDSTSNPIIFKNSFVDSLALDGLRKFFDIGELEITLVKEEESNRIITDEEEEYLNTLTSYDHMREEMKVGMFKVNGKVKVNKSLY